MSKMYIQMLQVLLGGLTDESSYEYIRTVQEIKDVQAKIDNNEEPKELDFNENN